MSSVVSSRPRVLLVIDVYGWAYHTLARGIVSCLKDAFDFTIVTLQEAASLPSDTYDLVHMFDWKSTFLHHSPLRRPVLKCIFDLTDWDALPYLPPDIYCRYAMNVDAIAVPTMHAMQKLRASPVPVFLIPEGVDTHIFFPGLQRSGPIIAGWAGNPSRAWKRFAWAWQACEDLCPLQIADGTLDEVDMVRFYQSIDIIICSSQNGEGAPRPVLEAMACGCFPVSFPVGAVPEIVTSGVNGLLVEEQSISALRSAIRWCCDHPETVRSLRPFNAEVMRAKRDWSVIAPPLAALYRRLLQ
ncbi:MAG: glycosyltransferase family 4 protein [Candidatus Peribacteraceae bacterium]|nr:glycosyltransferase family 4 protein [Candidatus Peribacteraceae bacterium]